MASPIIGILVSILLSYSLSASRPAPLQAWAWLPITVGAAIALIAAWLLRGQAFEDVIANWSPVSFTGVPLVLASAPVPMLVLVAWLTVYLIEGLALPEHDVFDSHPSASALLIPALAVVVFANNLITLLVGLGLVDLFSAYLALRRQTGERQALSALALNSLSSAGVLITVAVQYASGDSLSLPLAQLPAVLTPVIAVALVLRLRLIPVRAMLMSLSDLSNVASVVAGLIVLTRLPTFGLAQLPPWFFALAAVCALLALLVSILRGEGNDNRSAAVIGGSLYLAIGSAVVGEPVVTAAAASAWLLGCAVVTFVTFTSQARTNPVLLVTRTIGAACLLGVPATVGFIGQAGVIAASVKLPGFGAIALLVRVIALALLGYVLAREVLEPDATNISSRTGSRMLLGVVVAALTIIGMGLMLGIGDAVTRNGLLGWLAWLLSLVGAAALWRFRPLWRRIVALPRATLASALSFDWLSELAYGAVARLQAPLPRVFSVLESDGALVWAMIIVLLLVLISRPGGP